MSTLTRITIRGYSTEVHSAEMARDFKLSEWRQQCEAHIASIYPDFKQRNALKVIAEGQEYRGIDLAAAQAIFADIDAIASRCDAVEAQAQAILDDTTLTEAEKISAIDALSW